ncbi:MAG: hypothetical protein EA369_09960 [Bradymonadales bacterium]|nr:MAG: hypothetical protein EA369_09960 [Bradymonadales bacterium]
MPVRKLLLSLQAVSEASRLRLAEELPDWEYWECSFDEFSRLIVESKKDQPLSKVQILHLRSKPRITTEILDRLPQLKLIALGCAGFDHIDLEACKDRNVSVIHLPGVNSAAVAELSLALILHCLRPICEANARLKSGGWNREEFLGRELDQKKVGILGLGKIGSRLARALVALGAKVSACDPFVENETFDELGVERLELDELFESSEILSLHCPLNSETHKIVSASRLEKLPRSAILINTARAGLLDESALLESLECGQLSRVALDVFEEEPLPVDHIFRRHSQIFLTPHLGSRSLEAQNRMESEIIKNIIEFVKNNQLIHPQETA